MRHQAVDTQMAFAEAMRWLQPLHDYARDAYCEEGGLDRGTFGSLRGLVWAKDVLASVVAYEVGAVDEPPALSTWLLGAPVVALPDADTPEAEDLLRAIFVGVERMLAEGDGDDFMGAARLLCGLKRENRPHHPEWFGPETRRLWSLDPCRYTLGPADFWPQRP